MIPALGGSKGVLRKNVRLVGGVPLIERAVASARLSRLIDTVVVSADDEIAEIVSTVWGGTGRRLTELDAPIHRAPLVGDL